MRRDLVEDHHQRRREQGEAEAPHDHVVQDRATDVSRLDDVSGKQKLQAEVAQRREDDDQGKGDADVAERKSG